MTQEKQNKAFELGVKSWISDIVKDWADDEWHALPEDFKAETIKTVTSAMATAGIKALDEACKRYEDDPTDPNGEQD